MKNPFSLLFHGTEQFQRGNRAVLIADTLVAVVLVSQFIRMMPLPPLERLSQGIAMVAMFSLGTLWFSAKDLQRNEKQILALVTAIKTEVSRCAEEPED